MKTLTLPRRHVIKKKALFQSVFTDGRIFSGRHLVVRVLKNDGTPEQPTRIGVAAGKRIGCAVKRNRAKRLLREAYRLEQQKIKSGLFLIIVAKNAVLTAHLDEIRAELIYLLKKAHCLNVAYGMKN